MTDHIIHAHVLERTLCLRISSATGTCFALDVDGAQYIITAAHIIPPSQTSLTIELLAGDRQWTTEAAQIVGTSPSPGDIAVMALQTPIVRTKTLPFDAQVCLSQPTLFLGFPLGLAGTPLQGSNRPLALVKSAIVSQVLTAPNRKPQILLDGHNNPGFSGGPVVFRPLASDVKDSPWSVAAVVSGYLPQAMPILDAHGKQQSSLASNSGIMLTTHISYAIDIIRNNPIGPRL